MTKKEQIKRLLVKYHKAYETAALLHHQNFTCIDCSPDDAKIKKEVKELETYTKETNELLQDMKDIIKEVSEHGNELS